MDTVSENIEALELRFMQGWMRGDTDVVKKLAARKCMFVIGTNPPELLDRPSFVAAMDTGFQCLGFRFGQSSVRRHSRTAWFTTAADLELKLGQREWNGRFLVTGLWQKHRIGGWKLVERSLSALDGLDWTAERIRRLQLWH